MQISIRQYGVLRWAFYVLRSMVRHNRPCYTRLFLRRRLNFAVLFVDSELRYVVRSFCESKTWYVLGSYRTHTDIIAIVDVVCRNWQLPLCLPLRWNSCWRSSSSRRWWSGTAVTHFLPVLRRLRAGQWCRHIWLSHALNRRRTSSRSAAETALHPDKVSTVTLTDNIHLFRGAVSIFWMGD